MNEDTIELQGVVTESLPNAMFRVKIETGQEIICYLSGRMRKNKISVLVEDRVTLEVSAYDPTKGRITYRNK
jgi:translation initiation factor IF-1